MPEGPTLAFDGYAAVFHHRDAGGDIVMPGAFQAALAAQALPRPLLWQHQPAEPVGVVRLGRDDGIGLRITAELVLDSARGRDAAALLRAGALCGLSIGYRVRRASIDPATRARRLHELSLIEVSLVTFPMQPLARVLTLL